MAIQINSDTIVKILVRRGQNAERVNTVLTEGELGYTVDTQRLFIGDGITPGGHAVGNMFLGFTSNRAAYNSLAASGDTIFDTNIQYAWTGTSWISISPLLDSISLVRKSADNSLRISNTFPGAGFNIAYPDIGTVSNLAGNYNSFEFDSRYISLCAANTSFYLGNYSNKTVTNNLNATLNIDNSLFINDHSINPNQIQIYAKDPVYNSNVINAVSGALYVNGNTSLSLGTNLSGFNEAIIINGSTFNTVFSSSNNGSLSSPNFDFRGVANFESNVNMIGNVSIYGNLSAYGPSTFVNTLVTTTSALSVIGNYPTNQILLTVKQNYAQLDEAIAIFEGYQTPGILTIKDGPFIGVNVPITYTYENTGNTVLNMLGSGIITGRTSGGTYNDSFTINMNIAGSSGSVSIAGGSGGVSINGAGGVTLNPSSTVTLSPGNNATQVNGNLTVSSTIYCNGDIVAYYSDKRLKDNLVPINNALGMLDRLEGYTFDWNRLSNRPGDHDYGVVAQELELVMPEAVTTHSDGYKAVKYERLIPVLLQAIKELKAKVG